MAAKKKKAEEFEKDYSQEEFVKIVGIDERRLKDYRLKYGLPFIRNGREVRYLLSEYETWRKQRRELRVG